MISCAPGRSHRTDKPRDPLGRSLRTIFTEARKRRAESPRGSGARPWGGTRRPDSGFAACRSSVPRGQRPRQGHPFHGALNPLQVPCASKGAAEHRLPRCGHEPQRDAWGTDDLASRSRPGTRNLRRLHPPALERCCSQRPHVRTGTQCRAEKQAVAATEAAQQREAPPTAVRSRGRGAGRPEGRLRGTRLRFCGASGRDRLCGRRPSRAFRRLH